MPDHSTAPLTLCLFGPFEVRLNDQPLPRLRTRKGQWLLALLTLRHDREVERSWIAGTLWPDSPEAQGLVSLRSSLADLRRALGSEARRLHSPTPHSLRLELAGAEADVVAFDAAVARGDLSSLQTAVALHRGPLLEGYTEDWVFQERQVREQAYLGALEKLAIAAVDAGDLTVAEQYLQRAVTVDPLRESAHRSLMRVLAAGGNFAAAAELYRELRERLHRDAHAEPDPATQSLYQQLRAEARARRVGSGQWAVGSRSEFQRAAPGLPAEVPPLETAEASGHNLPLQLTSFIGREREMAEVKQRLFASRLVTLTGAGGCGKTRLSLQAAAELLPQIAGGVSFVELAPLAAPASGTSMILQAVAAALGMRETEGAGGRLPARSVGDWGPGPGEQPLLDGLITFLRGKELLLVLDNCEHLLAACAPLVERLLQTCPRLRILATSREALGISGEVIYPVPSLTMPDPCKLPASGDALVAALTRYEAVRLLIDRAGAVAPGFAVTKANALAVVQVCHQLDGIPLAIELAAARVKAMTVEQIARRLDDRFRLLTGGSRTALPRQQTLRALIDWSYDLLSDPERVLLCRLSVFAGGWTLEAAEAVCSGDPIEEWELLGLLIGLIDKSLVAVDEQEGEARYRLLETVRQYARDRLAETAEGPAVRERHAAFFQRLAEAVAAKAGGSGQAAAFERLERELHNLRAALEWRQSTEAGLEAGLQLAVTLAEFWDHRGLYSEGRELLQGLLGRGSELPAVWRARGLELAGSLAGFQGDYAGARSFLEAGLALFRELDDQEGVARTLVTLARVVGWEGDPAAARRLTEEALSIWRKLNDRRGLESALDWLGWECYGRGDLAAARACFEERAAISAEVGDHAGPYYGLGAVATARGEYEAARSLLEKGLALAREAGNMRVAAWGILRLGHLAYGQGNDEQARACYEESLALAREMHLGRLAAESLHRLMHLALKHGDEQGLRACAREVLTIARDRKIVAWCLECLARASMTWTGNAERAARLLGAAAAMHEPTGEAVIPADQRDEDGCIAARAALGEEAFAAAWAAGHAMPLEQVVCLALEEDAE